MKRLLVVGICLVVIGCTNKKNQYNFNQGVPEQDSTQVLRTLSAAGATASGGKGNTIIIIEEANMDTAAEGAISSGQGAAGKFRDAISDKITDLRKTDSDNPVTTTTNPAPATGNQGVVIDVEDETDLEEELAEGTVTEGE